MTEPKRITDRLVVCRVGIHGRIDDCSGGCRAPNPAEVQLARAWIARFGTRLKHANQWSSYGFKHWVEEWTGTYCGNGAFILAAHKAGYVVVSSGLRQDPNASFNMGIAKWNRLPAHERRGDFAAMGTVPSR